MGSRRNVESNLTEKPQEGNLELLENNNQKALIRTDGQRKGQKVRPPKSR